VEGLVLQPRLEEFPLGNVSEVDHHPTDTRMLKEVGHGGLQPSPGTIRVVETDLSEDGMPRLAMESEQTRARVVGLFGMDQIEDARADELFARPITREIAGLT
jgi:hypothetical protein